MCVSLPARLVVRWPHRGTWLGSVLHRAGAGTVDLTFVPDAHPGDYVIVHAGVAVRRLSASEAEEVGRLLADAIAG